MNLIIVVPSYNMNEQCYKNIISLHKQIPEAKILIVNNNSTDKKYINLLPKEIIVEDNIYPNSYEPGALLHAFNKYEYDNYFLIQDSIEMLDCFEIIDYVNKEYDFVLTLNLFCPAAHMMNNDHKEYMKKNFKSLASSIYMKPGIASNTFIAKRKHIQKIIDSGILIIENLPNNKLGSECWERIFGIAFSKKDISIKTFQGSYSQMLMNSIPHLSHEKVLHVLRYTDKYHKYLLGRS